MLVHPEGLEPPTTVPKTGMIIHFTTGAIGTSLLPFAIIFNHQLSPHLELKQKHTTFWNLNP